MTVKKNKSLKEKAIKIKGKDYVLVADRILYFNEEYDNGAITTDLVSMPNDDRIMIKARVYPDTDKTDRVFTGYSQATIGDGFINKTSALENCETSAVGRALAMMGIGVIESIASIDEINKAQGSTGTPQKPAETSRIGKCSICGAQGIRAKTKKGRIFNTCPNWKDHRDKVEKPTIVSDPILDKESKEFLESL